MPTAVVNAPKAMSAACNGVARDAAKCQIKFEKYKGGFKIRCRCEQADCATLQSRCQAVCDGILACSCTQNDIQVCNFNFRNADCKCENAKDGCCITCTSDDAKIAKTLQACCECMETCCKSGGYCQICFDNTCCCIGTCAA